MATESSSSNNFAIGATAGASLLSSLASGFTSARQNSASASSLARQSLLYDQQSSMYMRSAGAYSGAAKSSVAIGKANAKQERLKAAQIQQFTDAQIETSIKERRQKVGSGLAGFAANGILLESRDGAAVANWEQDESADLAVEQMMIIQKNENEAWGYLTAANQRVAEGYMNAASMYGQAAGAAASAYSSSLQSKYALADAEAARKAAKKSKIGGVVSGVLGATGAVIGGVYGGPVGAMAGASLGSSLGTAATV